MKTLYKFILKSFIGPMIVSFFVVMFVLMMNSVWRYIDELVGKGLDFSVIVELIVYATTNLIPLGLPLATLFAAIMTMGNLGENYELLAMKSAGISLFKIMKPLAVVMVFVSIGSFFVANDLVPYCNQRMWAVLYDIRRQKQAIEFKDGTFFGGIDNMSIRVERQDPKTKQLYGVLIYDNRNASGNMTVTLADSGHIRLSDDKRFLLVTLHDGETYEYTRNRDWYDKSALQHHLFKLQDGAIPMSGFNFERTDKDAFSHSSSTKNISELDQAIDSLEHTVTVTTARSYEPLLKNFVFQYDHSVAFPDSVFDGKPRTWTGTEQALAAIPTREKSKIWNDAYRSALNSGGVMTFDETNSKEALNQLYRSRIEWHRKISLPVSIMIFFLIGAPLGAIIRKGGMGISVVISVLFFVVYYVISLTGEKMVREGTWAAYVGMWVSTYVLFPISVYLTYKAAKDSNLMNTDWYVIKYNKIKNYLTAKLGKKKRIDNDEQTKNA